MSFRRSACGRRGASAHGNAGRANEWRLMPTLVGMSVEQERARLKQVGSRGKTSCEFCGR